MTAMVGDNYWIVVGPIVFTAGLLAWIGMVLWAKRRERQDKDRGTTRGQASHRGPVSGGIIEGSPVQRTAGTRHPATTPRPPHRAAEAPSGATATSTDVDGH